MGLLLFYNFLFSFFGVFFMFAELSRWNLRRSYQTKISYSSLNIESCSCCQLNTKLFIFLAVLSVPSVLNVLQKFEKKMRHSRTFLNFIKVSFVKYENITFPPMQSVCAQMFWRNITRPPLPDKFCLLVWIRVIAYDMHMFCFKDKLILSQEVSYFFSKTDQLRL